MDEIFENLVKQSGVLGAAAGIAFLIIRHFITRISKLEVDRENAVDRALLEIKEAQKSLKEELSETKATIESQTSTIVAHQNAISAHTREIYNFRGEMKDVKSELVRMHDRISLLYPVMNNMEDLFKKFQDYFFRKAKSLTEKDIGHGRTQLKPKGENQ